MKIRFKLSKAMLGLVAVFALPFLISSCCSHDVADVDEILVCNVKPADLEDAQCSEHMNSLPATSEVITVSALVVGNDPNTILDIKVFYTSATPEFQVDEAMVKISDLESGDLTDKCKVWLAVPFTSSPAGSDFIKGDYRVEVQVNTEESALLTKIVTID